MARMGGFSMDEMKNFQKQLQKLQQKDMELLFEECAKTLARKLLREVTLRTPVGNYDGGIYECDVQKGKKTSHHSSKAKNKQPGRLRKGWTAGEIKKEGNVYKIEIKNPIWYAEYVEYGHRTKNHRGWVQGHFMLTISEQELQKIAPKVLERKIKKFLGECIQ